MRSNGRKRRGWDHKGVMGWGILGIRAIIRTLLYVMHAMFHMIED
jgi:hypothetical protein